MNEKLMVYEYFINRIMMVSSNFMLFSGFSPIGTLPRKKTIAWEISNISVQRQKKTPLEIMGAQKILG